MSECKQCGTPIDACYGRQFCGSYCRNKYNNGAAKQRPVASDEHGKRVGYARGCRCGACREYNATYSRIVRERAAAKRAGEPKKPRKRPPSRKPLEPKEHGTASSYKFPCKCELCTAAAVAANAAWRAANIERVRRHERNFRLRNADRIKSYGEARRAAPFDEEAMAYVAILDGDPCCYCGAQGEVVIDHIVPVVASRDSSWGNLTAACHSCNSRKNRRSLLMFLRGEQVRRQLAA